jgi:hypothetical protein|tara:strand:- start:1323 stop:1556 length:234 start_codon:yes stop_codon:yes gene_type:complete
MSFKPVYTKYGALKKEGDRVVLVKGYKGLKELMEAELRVVSFLTDNQVEIRDTSVSLRSVGGGIRWILRIFVRYQGD